MNTNTALSQNETLPEYQENRITRQENAKIINIRNLKPSPKASELLDNLRYNEEPVRTGEKDENGKAVRVLNEYLSNFGDLATTPEGLEIFKKENKTIDLFKKMFLFGVKKAQRTGIASSVNVFLKDLSNPEIITETNQKEKELGFDGSLMCLEILEYNYGSFNEKAIEHLRILSKKGYTFAIDDFNLEYDPEDLSFDNLTTLFANNIIPAYVKFDGKYLAKIFNDKFDENHLMELRIIIKFLKSQGIEIIGEWIGNEEEGYKARSLGIELYQGKFLNDDFGLKKEEKEEEEERVESFKLVHNLKSFQLYRKNEKPTGQEGEKIYEQIAISPRILALMIQSSNNIDKILSF